MIRGMGSTGKARFWLSILIVAGVFSFPLWGNRTEVLKFPIYEFPQLNTCLNYSDHWEIRCPIDQFISLINDSKEKNIGKRFALAKALYNSILEIRKNQLESKQEVEPQYFTPKAEMDENTFIRFLYPSNFFPQRKYLQNREADFLQQTKAYLDEIQKLVDPLINVEDKDTKALLKNEAVELYFNALGDSLHFEALNQFLEINGKILLQTKKRRERTFRALDFWNEQFGAYPIKGWFLEKLTEYRPEKITGESEDEFFYWVKSLKLIPRPIAPNQKEIALDNIRKLWIAFPTPEKNLQLKKLLNYLGLTKEFASPAIAEMTPDEAFLRIRSFISALDGRSALRAVERVYDRAQLGKLTKSEIWEAFTLHVRILRLIDQREEIPHIINNYEKLAKFQVSPDNPSVVDLERMYKIATYYWTYEDPNNALKLMDKIEKLDKSGSFQARILYVRARIYEQSENFDSALVHMAKALSHKSISLDQKNDLMWRVLFLKMEKAKNQKDYKELNKEIDSIKSVASRSKDYDRWQYWKATIDLKAGDKSEAEKIFKDLFKREEFTFYGVMAGMALKEMGKEPEDWVLKVEPNNDEPEWHNYMDSEGLPKSPIFAAFVKVYNLVKAGEPDLAEESFYSLDGDRRDFLNDMRRSKSSKFYFARDVAWLRKKLGDPRGALQAAESLRYRYNKEITGKELYYLYPMAFWDLVESNAKIRGVDPWVVVSVIRQESVFDPNARSFANALGLMQMIPTTAQKEAKNLNLENFRLDSLYMPEQSIKLGVNHLADHLNAFDNSFICAFAAYNAGRPPVYKWLEYYNTEFPLLFMERISYKETRTYVKKLIRNYINYKRIYENAQFDTSVLFKMPQLPLLDNQKGELNYDSSSGRLKAQ